MIENWVFKYNRALLKSFAFYIVFKDSKNHKINEVFAEALKDNGCSWLGSGISIGEGAWASAGANAFGFEVWLCLKKKLTPGSGGWMGLVRLVGSAQIND